MTRPIALGRALLFLIVASPLWALKQASGVINPIGRLALVVALTLLFLWWDRRPPEVLGLDPRPRRLAELALGFLGGALLIAGVAAVMYFVLPFPWHRNAAFQPGAALLSLLILLVASGIEELLFRGYALERMMSAIGLWPAQILMALVFALYHMLHGWSWDTAIIGTTLGSILFGLVFARWRSVPAAVGVHAAGNWTRDLLLADPPSVRTFLGPVADRAWSSVDQFNARVVWNGIAFLACVVMAIVVYRQQRAEAMLESAAAS
jgi:membrane protease YdiL (CAAX protease family)